MIDKVIWLSLKLSSFYRETKKSFTCVKKYQPCLQSLAREVFNIMSRNARNLYKERCSTDSGKAGTSFESKTIEFDVSAI